MPAVRLVVAFLALIFAVCAAAQCGCDTPFNRAVLQDLYVSTQGPLWTNSSGWLLADTPVCSWYGVKCVGNSVDSIDLYDNNLNGTLPTSLGQLTNLTILILRVNFISDRLPAEWSAMTSLRRLHVGSNLLSGTIPPEWSAMNALRFFAANDNQLTGSIPAAWSALTALEYVYMDMNQLTGTLPATWSALKALEVLYLSNNKLTGVVPSEWPALPALQSLYVDNNQLSGCFDMCVFAEAFSFFQGKLFAANNSFSGPFNFSCVDSVSDCAILEEAVLTGNSFCGSACGLLPCGNASCSATANTANSGPIIAASEVISQAACCAACTARPQCVVAEWYASTGVCIMQSAIGATSSKPNVTLLIQQDRC